MPIVYILTNECMPDTVKIGIADNLEQRIRQLDNTSVALPFECYYAVEVPNASAIEKKIHQGLDDCRVRQNREFFNTRPERAKSLLEIAEIMGGKNVTPNVDYVETPQDQQALDKVRRSRKKFNFNLLGIDTGIILEFKKDNTITCEVANDTQVNFRGEVMSLSRSADIVLQEMGYDWGAVQGSAFWCLDGKSLHELRLESE
uniref:T5orf172 domain-containing protein n=1 Tax=Candidatus Kentrum sp. TC TaxID=2126339 RepID=A0A450YHU7_9GAMM|nr:MAG: T5orf172 domain-containing protein [Candidatus Kentron sp. TC]